MFFWRLLSFWTFQISWGWDKHACQTSCGNCCWNGIFQTKIISMNQFCQTLRWPTNFSTCLNFRRNVTAHSCMTLSTSWTRREKNLWEENADLKHWLNNLHVRLQSLQNDPDPTTQVTKLQEQVHYITLHILTSIFWQMKLNVIYPAYIGWKN